MIADVIRILRPQCLTRSSKVTVDTCIADKTGTADSEVDTGLIVETVFDTREGEVGSMLYKCARASVNGEMLVNELETDCKIWYLY
jgi:hypothetical protein